MKNCLLGNQEHHGNQVGEIPPTWLLLFINQGTITHELFIIHTHIYICVQFK